MESTKKQKKLIRGSRGCGSALEALRFDGLILKNHIVEGDGMEGIVTAHFQTTVSCKFEVLIIYYNNLKYIV